MYPKNCASLAEYLQERSAEICRDNSCDIEADDHNCESYAYITANYELIDLCLPDYFQGWDKPYAAIALPWEGTQEELEKEVDNDITES